MSSGKFRFESAGIGELLHRGRLVVPANQRPYAWDAPHVTALLQDLWEAIENDEEDYFLGTVVLIQNGKETPSIADGQQRIVTTSILLARIRDRQQKLGRQNRADAIETGYLRDIDIDTEERVPRIRLNIEDHEFFVSHVLNRTDGSPSDLPVKMRASNKRLLKASQIIASFLNDICKQSKDESELLNKWVKFIREGASVVIVTAEDEIGAFRMFETLNDRGLKAGAADILKNYLFSKADSRLVEAQMLWNNITGAIDALGDDENERLVTYLRHFWVLTHGPTKERELAKGIKFEITGETKALTFLSSASAAVETYVSLWSSKHPIWASHKSATRHSVDTISNHLRVEQIRPLMFAVALRFDPEEAEKAFRLFVSWSVRFLIFGGRGGMLDEQYSRRAEEVGTGRITKARELRDAMSRYVPTDAEFEAAFATARVSRANFARYYLRAIEKSTKDDPQPEYVANEEADQVSLDHVLPLTPGDDWDTSEDEAEAVQKMLGNMVLLRANQNREIGNKGFSARKATYGNSGYNITRMVSEYPSWGPDEIRDRQARLAKLAVATWPLNFGNS